jgi:hypothetical protein
VGHGRFLPAQQLASWIYCRRRLGPCHGARSIGDSACQLWVAIEGPFLANKEPRAIFLHEEFSSMKQGPLH